MNYKEIVNNVKKYHYYVSTDERTILLSSSNSKSEAKKLALEKLKPNIQNIIGDKLILVRIKSVIGKYEKQKTSNNLKVIGGPILFLLERGLIKSHNKIKNFVEDSNNKSIFIK